jgi:hypothetical protein
MLSRDTISCGDTVTSHKQALLPCRFIPRDWLLISTEAEQLRDKQDREHELGVESLVCKSRFHLTALYDTSRFIGRLGCC